MEQTKTKNFYDLQEIRDDVFQGKLSTGHIYGLIKTGEIPSKRFGARILVPAGWVKKMLGDQE